MGSNSSSVAILFCFNVLIFALLVNLAMCESTQPPLAPSPAPESSSTSDTIRSPTPAVSAPSPAPESKFNSGKNHSLTPAVSAPTPAPGSSSNSGTNHAPTPTVSAPSPVPKSNGRCRINLLRLAVCSPVLNLPNTGIVAAVRKRCCGVLQSLVYDELPVCLCLANKSNILGPKAHRTFVLNLLLQSCNIQRPTRHQCT